MTENRKQVRRAAKNRPSFVIKPGSVSEFRLFAG